MKPLVVFIAVIFASLAVTRAAVLTYEVTGRLTEVSFGSSRLVGTPFTVRFSYSPDSIQTAEIYGDFPARAVVTLGEVSLNAQPLISFSDHLFWHYTAYNSFWLDLSMSPTTAEPLMPTITPEFSSVHISLPFPDGFLPDGRLFDDSTLTVSPTGDLTFDYRLIFTANDYGRGEIHSIRLVPEPSGLALAAAGLLVLGLRRLSPLPCVP